MNFGDGIINADKRSEGRRARRRLVLLGLGRTLLETDRLLLRHFAINFVSVSILPTRSYYVVAYGRPH